MRTNKAQRIQRAIFHVLFSTVEQSCLGGKAVSGEVIIVVTALSVICFQHKEEYNQTKFCDVCGAWNTE
jgi:hypothetical protein